MSLSAWGPGRERSAPFAGVERRVRAAGRGGRERAPVSTRCARRVLRFRGFALPDFLTNTRLSQPKAPQQHGHGQSLTLKEPIPYMDTPFVDVVPSRRARRSDAHRVTARSETTRASHRTEAPAWAARLAHDANLAAATALLEEEGRFALQKGETRHGEQGECVTDR